MVGLVKPGAREYAPRAYDGRVAVWTWANNPDPEPGPQWRWVLTDVRGEMATLSAKAGSAGKDLGKPGKNFAKIAAKGAAEYGSEEAGEKVAGAVLNKMRQAKFKPHNQRKGYA